MPQLDIVVKEETRQLFIYLTSQLLAACPPLASLLNCSRQLASSLATSRAKTMHAPATGLSTASTCSWIH
jgi:hypothetical protein